jgi:hypothetical protein
MALHGMEQKPVPYREKVKSRKSFQVSKNWKLLVIIQVNQLLYMVMLSVASPPPRTAA